MKQVPIGKVKKNPNNPRNIDKSKLKKLIDSVDSFPEMMKLRPVIVNKDMVVLGGNMRLQAAKQLGLDKVWVEVADLTPEQEQEFIIKDNASFGEWDWDMLEEWDADKLTEWGLDVPEEKKDKEIEPDVEFSEFIGEANNYVVLVFDNELDWLNAETHFGLKTVASRRRNGKPWNKGIGRVLNGANYMKGLNET
jgi:ParB-like chromosome segregation protein Spo0J